MKIWKNENIEEFRRDCGLTRKALAEILGITVNHVYKIEKGIANPSKGLMLFLSHLEGHWESQKRKGGPKADEKGNL
jgi:DNA-binding XRE family transcriptional regulator